MSTIMNHFNSNFIGAINMYKQRNLERIHIRALLRQMFVDMQKNAIMIAHDREQKGIKTKLF